MSHVTLNWVVCELFSDWPLCINGNYCLALNYVRVERELFDIELFGCIGVWVCESAFYTTSVFSIFVSETFSLSPPVDVGQRPNHVNPWCSLLYVVYFSFRVFFFTHNIYL